MPRASVGSEQKYLNHSGFGVECNSRTSKLTNWENQYINGYKKKTVQEEQSGTRRVEWIKGLIDLV